MAVFNAYALVTKAGQLVHRTVFLVRKNPGPPSKTSVPWMKEVHEFVETTYDQQLQPFDIEVVDADDLKARIKKLNKGLPKKR